MVARHGGDGDDCGLTKLEVELCAQGVVRVVEHGQRVASRFVGQVCRRFGRRCSFGARNDRRSGCFGRRVGRRSAIGVGRARGEATEHPEEEWDSDHVSSRLGEHPPILAGGRPSCTPLLGSLAKVGFVVMTDASAAMHKRDHVAKELGIEITHAEVGLAVVSMTVEERMTNGLGVCHGGLLFTLADTAMAHASNAGNERTLSTTASIEWISTARIGDHLVATSRAVAQRGRNTVHDITVTNGNGDTVALVRGQTLTLGGPVLDA